MKPILFNTEGVRAIMDGRKTVTRQVIPEKILDKYYDYDDFCSSVMPSDIPCTREYEEEFFIKRAQYQVGDILYVKETWRHSLAGGFYVYKADAGRKERNENLRKFDSTLKWKPSVHMPEEAARIFLKVTSLRVERLQDITEKDAIVEGIPYEKAAEIGFEKWSPIFNDPDSGGHPEYREAFIEMWNKFNKKRGYGWEANPWVWVIEFERVGGRE